MGTFADCFRPIRHPKVSTDAAPAMAVGANNLLYMVWKTPGADAGMEWSVYDGSGWSDPAPIPSAKTNVAPALAAFNTSGPGNVWPLCLAYKGATGDGVFWAMFTPGSATLTQNTVPGASTDVSPAVTSGPGAGSTGKAAYVLVWKPKGETSFSFVSVDGNTAGEIYTLPQVESNFGPAAYDSWNTTSGFGASPFDNLNLAYVNDKTGDVWRGVWSVILNPAPFPSNASNDLEGSSNYVFYSAGCALLNKVVVSIAVTEALESTQGYSFQLNANTPTNAPNYSRCNWQQCGFQVDSLGNLSSWVNNWTLKGFASNTPTGQPNPWDLSKWSTPTIPAGSTLTIALEYDNDLTVIAAKFTFTQPGSPAQSNKIVYDQVLLSPYPTSGEVPSNYLAPFCMLQLVIVGFDGGADATFTKGAGTITFSAAEALIAGDSRPCNADKTSTAEQSNLFYGVLPATASKSLVQTFCTSYKSN